ncbi:hypothetical protein XBKQ1_2230003 [Xenorhabdus bovienii str. kraussei Quebec]|uniref:Uncharacterized protein n=3 Tax=Xenorhabdus bovienii TaxID=40576 RepID=A0A077PG66_XENBV|nr:hypothetical protein XBO1_600026 [Xenorhabdus bovienii str. oregonense]CDH19651.1 hypothetical protein XBKQ1_2230003 [Xenorhabdus bovienii str. kraussei Quebec]CDH33101.1 hypothetical protein XBI1_2370024 [Xenorhabdus bovienii str. Intermedium]
MLGWQTGSKLLHIKGDRRGDHLIYANSIVVRFHYKITG